MPTADLSHLDTSFTEEEMWSAIKSMPNDRAPGPDGFTVEFYRSALPIIKRDLLLALDAFNRMDRRGMNGFNNALITLLPKKTEAKTAADYRPICLIHSFAKVVAKMMALRLAPELNRLVDVNQSAFIRKCSTHDNFKFVQTSAKVFKQRRMPKLLLKLRHHEGLRHCFMAVSTLGTTTHWIWSTVDQLDFHSTLNGVNQNSC